MKRAALFLVMLCFLVGSYGVASVEAAGASATIVWHTDWRRATATFNCPLLTTQGHIYYGYFRQYKVNGAVVGGDEAVFYADMTSYSSGNITWYFANEIVNGDVVTAVMTCHWKINGVVQTPITASSSGLGYTGGVTPGIEIIGDVVRFKCWYTTGHENTASDYWVVALSIKRNNTEIDTGGVVAYGSNESDMAYKDRQLDDVWDEGDELSATCTLVYDNPIISAQLKDTTGPSYWPN